MASYSNIVVVFSDEVGRPRNLQVLGENDTIADEVLSPEVRDAVTKVPELTEATGNLQTQIDAIEGISVTAIEQDIIVLKDATGVLNDQVTGLYTATAGLYNQVTAIEGIDITDVQNDIQILFDSTADNYNDITGFYQITADLDTDILDNFNQITSLKDATATIDGKFGGIYDGTADNYNQVTSLKDATATIDGKFGGIYDATADLEDQIYAVGQVTATNFDNIRDNFFQITSLKDATAVIDAKFGGVYDGTADNFFQITALKEATGTLQTAIDAIDGATDVTALQQDIQILYDGTGDNYTQITSLKDATSIIDGKFGGIYDGTGDNYTQITSLKDATATIDGKFGGIYDGTADNYNQITSLKDATAVIDGKFGGIYNATGDLEADILDNFSQITSLKDATATIDGKFGGIYNATADLEDQIYAVGVVTGVHQTAIININSNVVNINNDLTALKDATATIDGKFPGIYDATGDLTGVVQAFDNRFIDIEADVESNGDNIQINAAKFPGIYNGTGLNFHDITSIKDATADLQFQINTIYDQTGDNYNDITGIKDATADIAVDIVNINTSVTSLKDATALLAGDIAAIDGISNPMTEPLDLADFNIVGLNNMLGDNINLQSDGDATIRSGWGGSQLAATGTLNIVAEDILFRPNPNPAFGVVAPTISLGKGLLITDTSAVPVSGDDGTTVDDPENGAVLMLDTAAAKLKYKKIRGANIDPISIGGDRFENGTITDDKISNGTITGGSIATGTITGDNILTGTITGDNIQDGSIDGTKLSNATTTNSIGFNKLTLIPAQTIVGNSEPLLGGPMEALTAAQAAAIINNGNQEITGNVGINTAATPTVPLQIEDTGTDDVILVETQDDSSNAGPVITLSRVTDASPAANNDYIGQFKFKGESDTGVERVYAKITGKIDVATNGNEDGIIEFMNRNNGSEQIAARFKGNSFRTLNGVDVLVDGNLGVGTNNPSAKLDVQGDIAVTGTVDGRDIAADGTKLDTIATGATENSGDLADLDTVGTSQINLNAVTHSRYQLIGNNTILGNDTGLGSNPQELSVTEVKTMLDLENSIFVGATTPTSTTNGDLWYHTTDQELYAYDSTRSKWLSVNTYEAHFGRGGTLTTSHYLRGPGNFEYNTGGASPGGYPLRYNVTVIAAWGNAAGGTSGWNHRIMKYDDSAAGNVVAAVYSPAGTYTGWDKQDFNLDYDVSDLLALNMQNTGSATSITNHVATIGYKRRPS